MRLGLFLSPQETAAGDMVALLDDLLTQVRTARDEGFAAVMSPHHVLSDPYQMLQPVPLLARVAAEAGDMDVATGVMLVTLLNPVEVAENVATLDVITGGRLVLGVGLGYREVEDRAFAVPERRVRVFLDKLDVVRRLLEGETVTAEGPGYRLDGARLALRPVQRPRPPIWMAANNDAAVVRAARHADAWLLNPHATLADLERQMRLFRERRERAPTDVPCVREVCVAPTDEEAVALAAVYLSPKYAAYVRWGQSEVMPEGDTLDRGWEDLRAGRFLVGSPATVAGQLAELERRAGVTTLFLRAQWPGMDPAHTLRTIRLMAREVMPRL